MVENGYVEPNFEYEVSENQQRKLEENKKLNASALSMLHRAVADPSFPRICGRFKGKKCEASIF